MKNKMQVIAIVQARMSSSRLPNKVLMPILNKPMLEHQITRIKRAKLIDKIIIATSSNIEDNAIAKLGKQMNITVYQGDLHDVLSRYYHAAQSFNSKHIVRLTGDCPLIDADIIDQVISLHIEKCADYTSNCQKPCFPDGLDVEIFTKRALMLSFKNAIKPSEREHVTQYMRNHPELFRLVDFQSKVNLSHLRWTVDEKEDFELVTQIYQNLYKKNSYFNLAEILQLLQKKTELNQINNHYLRDEGLAKSLLQDKKLGYQ